MFVCIKEQERAMKKLIHKGLIHSIRENATLLDSSTVSNPELDSFLSKVFQPTGKTEELSALILVPADVPDDKAEEYARNYLKEMCKGVKKHG